MTQKSPESGPKYWRFPPLEVRLWRQLETVEKTSGIRTVARACTVTNTYYLVRMPSRGISRSKAIAALSGDDRHFVKNNETPAERAKRSRLQPKGE